MRYIYKITNLTNNKVYIGQTINPNKRWNKHKYLAKIINKPQYIHCAMAKYGIENFTFEVIASCIVEDIKEIDAIEDDIINQYQSRNSEFGYNIKPGGPSRSGFKQSEEVKKKMSETWHQHHSAESLKKMHDHNIGRIPSIEQRQKVAIANKGNQFCLGHKQSQDTINKRVATINAQYGDKKCNAPGCNRNDGYKINGIRYCSLHNQRLTDTGTLELLPRPPAYNKGIPMSKESKEKLSNALKGRLAHNKGKPHKQETIDKLRELNLGKEPPNKMKFTEEQIITIQSDKRSLRVIAKDWHVSTTVINRIKRLNSNT